MNLNRLVPDRKQRFWLFQIVGWTLFGIMYLYSESQMTGPNALSGKYILTIFISLFTGFAVSLLLRVVYRIAYRKNRSIVVFALISLVCSLLGSLLWFSFMDLIELALDLGMPYSVWTQTHASGFTDYVVTNLLFLSSPLFAWSFIYFGYKLTEDLNREKEKYQRSLLQAKEAQLRMLRYQINPHFLFNSLNSVQALMYKDTAQADEMLTEFSEFLRYTLESKDEVYVSLEQEIDMLSRYLYLEKIRFQEKLQYRIDIRDDTRNLRILSFLLQPFVENAIKHGISETTSPLKIEITSERTDRMLLITVRNSGRWKESGKGTGIGIANVRSRLENAYPGKHALSIAEKENWVIVELKLHL